jgi:hypothetical protein
MTAIERRSRWLLFVYPRWYRQQRADEILGTLMEATGPDRSWPSSKDAWALILAGLRVRAGLGQRQTVRTNLSQALLFAAVLVLAAYSAGHLSLGVKELGHSAPLLVPTWLALVLGLATLALIAGVWFSPGKVVAVAALISAGLGFFEMLTSHLGDWAIQAIISPAVITVLALRQPRLPRSWLWLAGAWYLVHLQITTATNLAAELYYISPLVVLAVAIAWCVLDVRPMFAVAVATAVYWVSYSVQRYCEISNASCSTRFSVSRLMENFWPWEAIAITSLMLAIVAVWRLRRQALL